jgi:RimJ/RimL family protein N-acetyltransferase
METARCVVRAAESRDLAALVSAVQSPRFPTRLPLGALRSHEQLARWLEGMRARMAQGTAFLWSVDVKDGEPCVGQVALSLKAGASAWALSYWVAPPHWGQGFAREQVSCVLQAAFEALGIPEIRAGTPFWNHASSAVLERLGFRLLGDNPAGYVVAGTPEPVHEYGLTLAEWQRR